MTVDSVEQKGEAKTEDCSCEECREDGNLLPPNLNPGIRKEADCEHNEGYEA